MNILTPAARTRLATALREHAIFALDPTTAYGEPNEALRIHQMQKMQNRVHDLGDAFEKDGFSAIRTPADLKHLKQAAEHRLDWEGQPPESRLLDQVDELTMGRVRKLVEDGA